MDIHQTYKLKFLFRRKPLLTTPDKKMVAARLATGKKHG
jgi:hypothetical protein